MKTCFIVAIQKESWEVAVKPIRSVKEIRRDHLCIIITSITQLVIKKERIKDATIQVALRLLNPVLIIH